MLTQHLYAFAQAPATYHSVIGGVLKWYTLNVIGSEGSWFKVNYQGKQATLVANS